MTPAPIVAGETTFALTVLDAAFEAWAQCGPDGYLMPENIPPVVLAEIANKVPGSKQSSQTEHMMADLFMPTASKDGLSIFEKMLKPRDGQVHFLNFWRAFSEAARLLTNLDNGVRSAGNDTNNQPGHDASSLVDEVELLRDTVLRTLDMQASGPDHPHQAQDLAVSELAQLIHETAAMSWSPEFWNSLEQGLCGGRQVSKLEKLNWDDMTSVMISWLREAAAWRQNSPEAGVRQSADLMQNCAERKMLVLLHIYDVSHEDNVHKLNKVFAHKRSPFKFGGIFHAGVEVNGLEWSFGMSMAESMPGISCSMPREHSEHRYRQTVKLRSTRLSAEEVADLISQLIEEYPGDDYDLLRRNCCHFADDFAKRLGAGRIPGWVHRLARVGAFVDGALQRVANRSLLPEEEDLW
jgi:hypothetical protein